MGTFRKATFATVIAVFGAALLSGCSGDENALDEYNANKADIDFTNAASVANYTQVILGRIDQQRGTDSAGKDYGDSMVAVHAASNSLLKSLAMPLGLGTRDTLDAEHQALRVYLNTLSGRSFDSAYIKNMVADHQAAVDLYNYEVAHGQQISIRSFASSQLPVLQAYLDKATAIAAQY